MRILLNGDEVDLGRDTTLGAVVDSLDRGRSGMAVAINERVVPRSRWDARCLFDGDRVEILTAAQGG